MIMATMIWKLDINTSSSPDNICKKLWKSVYKKRALAFSIFLISVGPNYGPFYTYFLRKELGFTPDQFQWITLSSAISFLISTFTYKSFLLKIHPLKLMRISCYCGVLCELFQLLVVTRINDSLWIIILDTVGQSLFGMWLIMPLIVVIAHNAKDGVEGTFYALLMAFSNLSNVVADELGGLIGNMIGVTRENFDNMAYLIILCAISDLFFQSVVINNKSFASYFDEVHRPRGRKRVRRIQGRNTATLEIPAVSLDRDCTQETLDSPCHTPDSLDSVEVDLDHTQDLVVALDHTRDLSDALDHTRDLSDATPVKGDATPVKEGGLFERVQKIAQQVMPPVPPSAYRVVSDSDSETP